MPRFTLITLAPLILSCALHARDIRSELQQAEEAGNEARSLVTRDQIKTWWSADGKELVYRVNAGPARTEFIRVIVATGVKGPAFDHAAVAESLYKASGKPVDPAKLPIDFVNLSPSAPMVLGALGKSWQVAADGKSVSPATITPVEVSLQTVADARRAKEGTGTATTLTFRNVSEEPVEYFWSPEKGRKVSYGTIGEGRSATISTYGGHLWIVENDKHQTIGALRAPDLPAVARITDEKKSEPSGNLSPDGKWHALIVDGNVFIEPTAGGEKIPLSTDGTAEVSYRGPFRWSPDSTKLVAHHCKKVTGRKINIVQSSPPDQLQPKLITLDYAKPGDEIEQPKPRLFSIADRRQIPLDDALYPNPWSISELEWTEDSSSFSFVYNQRGHQILRVIAVDADKGTTRTVIEEKSATFIDYSQKFFMQRLPATGEILWASERSGYNHLYLIDGKTGKVKNPVTSGNLNVRKVMEVDAEKRQLILQIVGTSESNPYYGQFVRIGFEGNNGTKLTEGDGDHLIEFSPDGKHILDTWSRVDQPPVRELRDAATGRRIAILEQAEDRQLLATGRQRPERFVAKGRDGETDIHGIIIRPAKFDPAKKYPVLEEIYAGPHDHFVPTQYPASGSRYALADLGFILVRIDGMGTNWRSRKFHDVAWKNLRDAGFPDRIAWMKAAASTRPWMDLSRVGIYGGSAGGQNTLAGLLHHGDFYKAGVADCGCHDNRMDKIWWNEAWMGWPVDKSYEENSNVAHAAKLTGKLMLIVGEVDRNVDPASTAQVINALEKADKDFEFVPVMNSDHGAAESPYGKRRRAQFLVDALGEPSP